MSYVFWSATAVMFGVLAMLSANYGLKRVYGSFSGLYQPIIYKAKDFPSAFDALPEGRKNAYYAVEKGLKKPKVTAKSYLVADLDSGTIILEKNKTAVLPIASITKLMTALVSLDEIGQDEMASVPQYVRNIPYYKVGGLKIGQLIKTGDLLYPLLLESSNSAAETIANHYGRENFIKKMNEKAKKIGLSRTVFADPSGVSPQNKSTAQDMFDILSYIKEYQKTVLEISKKNSYSADSNDWSNINLLSGMENYLGGKTGHTSQAKETIAAAFSMPVAYDSSRDIGIVLLQSESREDDTLEMLDYIKENIRYGSNYLAKK